jgi:hypothetical protein
MLDDGGWRLDAGCWMLDDGGWMLDAGYVLSQIYLRIRFDFPQE